MAGNSHLTDTSLTSTPIKSSKHTIKTLNKASPSQRESQSVHVNSLADKKRRGKFLPLNHLPNDGVKIVNLIPSGNVTVRSPQDSQTKTKNIAAV